MESDRPVQLISKAAVLKMLDVSQTTLYRMCTTDASFPQPIQVGGRPKWFESELYAWIQSRDRGIFSCPEPIATSDSKAKASAARTEARARKRQVTRS